MQHTLTINLPDELYEALRESAERAQTMPEELIVKWLETAVQRVEVADDPLEKYIGMIKSNIPDWSGQHDKYLGQELLSDHRDTSSAQH